MNEALKIYTDGGCSGNPGPGGWAFYAPASRYHEAGSNEQTSNNRMELTAVIRALHWVLCEDATAQVEIYTDSQYVQKGITEWLKFWLKNNWRTKSRTWVLNRDLWEELNDLVKKTSVNWFWVRGHSNNAYNEICHNLVQEQIKKLRENSY